MSGCTPSSPLLRRISVLSPPIGKLVIQRRPPQAIASDQPSRGRPAWPGGSILTARQALTLAARFGFSATSLDAAAVFGAALFRAFGFSSSAGSAAASTLGTAAFLARGFLAGAGSSGAGTCGAGSVPLGANDASADPN